MKYRCFVLIIISYNFLWTYDYTGTYRLHCGVNNDGRCDTVTNTLLQWGKALRTHYGKGHNHGNFQPS